MSFVQDPVGGQNIDPDFEKWEERQRDENAVPEGYYFDGEYETYTNWVKIDYIDLTVDVCGIAIDGLVFIGITVEIGIVFQIVECLGVGKSFYDLYIEYQYDSLTTDAIEHITTELLDSPKRRNLFQLLV